MALLDRVGDDLVAAMKAKDELRLGVLRMMKSALKKYEVDSQKSLTETSEAQVLATLVKQREESADLFRKGGRQELAEKEESEIEVLRRYLPSPASDVEMNEAIAGAIGETKATSTKQMGAVMKAAQARLQGKFVDGKVLSEKVKSHLAAAGT